MLEFGVFLSVTICSGRVVDGTVIYFRIFWLGLVGKYTHAAHHL